MLNLTNQKTNAANSGSSASATSYLRAGTNLVAMPCFAVAKRQPRHLGWIASTPGP